MVHIENKPEAASVTELNKVTGVTGNIDLAEATIKLGALSTQDIVQKNAKIHANAALDGLETPHNETKIPTPDGVSQITSGQNINERAGAAAQLARANVISQNGDPASQSAAAAAALHAATSDPGSEKSKQEQQQQKEAAVTPIPEIEAVQEPQAEQKQAQSIEAAVNESSTLKDTLAAVKAAANGTILSEKVEAGKSLAQTIDQQEEVSKDTSPDREQERGPFRLDLTASKATIIPRAKTAA